MQAAFSASFKKSWIIGKIRRLFKMNSTDEWITLEQEVCGLRKAREVTIAEMVACIIAVLTVLENSMILTAITRGHRSLRKPPYWFIANLAIADLLTGVEVVLAIFIPIGTSPLSRICLKGLAVVTFIASVNSLLLVSVDRYIRIVRHTDYSRLLNRHTIVALIVLCWIFAFGVFLAAPLLGWSCAEQHCCAYDGLCACRRSKFGADVCSNECSQSFVPFTKSYILVGLIYFVISVAVMTTSYAIIFKVVRQKTFGGGDSKSKKRDVQLAKTLVITLGIFVLCWLPVQGLFIADIVVTEYKQSLLKVFDYALVPSVINSFMNPIIYSIRLPQMRTTIQGIFLPCMYGKSKNGSTWGSTSSHERRSFRIPTRRRDDRKRALSNSSCLKSPTTQQQSRGRAFFDESSHSLTNSKDVM